MRLYSGNMFIGVIGGFVVINIPHIPLQRGIMKKINIIIVLLGEVFFHIVTTSWQPR